MKRLSPVLLPGLLIPALIIAGCGKSEEFKKMESDLAASVSSLHDDLMSLTSTGTGLSAKIDGAIAKYDSMAAKYPKVFAGQSSDDLKDAKAKLASAADSMNAFMANMKAYDPSMDHMQAMAQLTQEKDAITGIKAQFESAITAATTALQNHAAFAEKMAGKMGKGMKKGSKN